MSEPIPSPLDRLIIACHRRILAWQREAAQYEQSARASGLADGQNPKEMTAYQSQCATSASIYRTCAHDMERILKAMEFSEIN